MLAITGQYVVIKQLIKRGFSSLGLKIERRDPLEESIPADYNHSPFLPRIYRGSLDRCLYFLNQLEKIRGVEGDIVECGVSIGHGALLFLLLSQYLGVERTYYGFDSFEGFPDPVAQDDQRDQRVVVIEVGEPEKRAGTRVPHQTHLYHRGKVGEPAFLAIAARPADHP